jgi:hypothetical protein
MGVVACEGDEDGEGDDFSVREFWSEEDGPLGLQGISAASLDSLICNVSAASRSGGARGFIFVGITPSELARLDGDGVGGEEPWVLSTLLRYPRESIENYVSFEEAERWIRGTSKASLSSRRLDGPRCFPCSSLCTSVSLS